MISGARWPRCALILMSLGLAFLFLLSWSPDADAAYRLHLRNGGMIEVPSYQETGGSISYPRFGGTVSVPKTEVLRIESVEHAPSPAEAKAADEEAKRAVEYEAKVKKALEERGESYEGGPGWWFSFQGRFFPRQGRSELIDVEVGPYPTKELCLPRFYETRASPRWQGRFEGCYHATSATAGERIPPAQLRTR